MSSLNFKGYRHTKRGWGEEKQQIFGRAREQLVAIRLLLAGSRFLPTACSLLISSPYSLLLAIRCGQSAVTFSTKFCQKN